MNIDAEIYLKQLFTFFNGNPEALISLIGDLSKESFYQKIKDTVYEKIKNEDEFLLTKKQMIDIIKDLWDEQNPSDQKYFFEIVETFFKTDFGLFSLN